MEPVGYDKMLTLMASARVVVTDSGGLQEEAAWLRVPVVVLRRSTPRWEGVCLGMAELTGLDLERVVAAAVRLSGETEQERVGRLICPYGDGHSGQRIAELLAQPDAASMLQLTEPDFTRGATPC